MGTQPGKPDFSNVQGSVASTAPDAPAKADFSNVESSVASTAPDAPASDPQTYTVVAGDNLSKIAKKIYGNAGDWHRIFDANRDQISNPDLIKPGQVLKIPTKA